ncbi:uncharacterized protein JCM10292_001655 [Rhodotorula paludigena]|uniref:uncharacterized protein n=1 Tax=Rhodotorula paludigena TaxID=86838 RepID=UPI00317D2FDE
MHAQSWVPPPAHLPHAGGGGGSRGGLVAPSSLGLNTHAGPAPSHEQGYWAGYDAAGPPERAARTVESNANYSATGAAYGYTFPDSHRPSFDTLTAPIDPIPSFPPASNSSSAPPVPTSTAGPPYYGEENAAGGVLSRKRGWDEAHAAERAAIPPFPPRTKRVPSGHSSAQVASPDGWQYRARPGSYSAGHGDLSHSATSAPTFAHSYYDAPNASAPPQQTQYTYESHVGSSLAPRYASVPQPMYLSAEHSRQSSFSSSTPSSAGPSTSSSYSPISSLARPHTLPPSSVAPSEMLMSYHDSQPSLPASLPPVSLPPSWATSSAPPFEPSPLRRESIYRPTLLSNSSTALANPLRPAPPPAQSSWIVPPVPAVEPMSSRPFFSGDSLAYSMKSRAPDAAQEPPAPYANIYLRSSPALHAARPMTTSSLPLPSTSTPAASTSRAGPPFFHEAKVTSQAGENAAYSPASDYFPSSAAHSTRHSISADSTPQNYPFAAEPAAIPSYRNPLPTSSRSGSLPPPIRPETIPRLQQASNERAMHRSSAPILAFNPAREPASTGKQLVQSAYGVTYAVAASGQSKGKARAAEVPAVCSMCGLQRAKVIMRGTDLTGWTPRLDYSCLDCLPLEEHEGHDAAKARQDRLEERAWQADVAASIEVRPSAIDAHQGERGVSPALSTHIESPSSLAQPFEHDRATFKDSFSGAVDYLEGDRGSADASSSYGTPGDLVVPPTGSDSRLLLPPEETSKGLPAHLRKQALTCDVCDRVIGAGSVSSLSQGSIPSFTVEVICASCLDKYKPCSDCGGGGGRLTPGRWRCKELFPANRRTCTLSHARNPPLSDIEYDIVRVTELNPAKLEALETRCRLLYYNTRMRTQARPEMLERGDGLATTYAQCEKLTVDGWSLLKPLMSVDVESTTGMRRYVGLQTSTPHRRRSKPKPGAPPRPEPPEPLDPMEKEVSGFVLVEHDLKTGAIFVAVTMPWAIAGDAFDATTILIDEAVKRIRSDLRSENAVRREHGEPPLPNPWCMWGITPFKADSRMTQSLSRRSFVFLEDYVKEKPETDLTVFPPTRQIHIPNEFLKTFKIFLRDVTDEDGNGATSTIGSSAKAGGGAKKAPRQRARKLKASK